MKKVLIIAGPTGVGKTDFSVKIAQVLNGEIVCLDSRQIYKYFKIGTAFPDEVTLKTVKHHLFGEIDPSINFTAYDYKIKAENIIENIINQGKLPILVGGTGFYIDALLNGFLNVESNYGLRSYLRKLEDNNPGILRKILVDLDPQSALKIHPNDIKRIIRAIEIYIVTGNKMGEIIKENKTKNKKFDFDIFILDRNRQELHERINQRVEKMLEQGLIDEVKYLLSLGYSKNLNALNTIGYKEVIQYLEGRIDFNKMVHLIKVHTRNYARRQIIYFRRLEKAKWINLSLDSEENVIKQIIKNIKN